MRGRLWRRSDPALSIDIKATLVKQLMDARRSLRGTPTDEAREQARKKVNEAKRALGERGAVWWMDGAPDYNRTLVKNSPYSSWFDGLNGEGVDERNAT